ncbi:MAG: hypothetical protein Q4G68_11620 [Planctomycetia bacterium]|nr:hypothetical protein [Planctomycetia bacterium]
MSQEVRLPGMRKERLTRTELLSPEACLPGRILQVTVFFSLVAFFLLPSLYGATYETPNFVVKAKSASFAKRVGDTAERCREELAMLWLGVTLQPWSTKCPIDVKAGRQLGAGGETSFTFSDGEVFDWKMRVQGSEERILDSVIPHEVSHTILATWFRRPVPRWIDEGAATSVESQMERDNYRQMLVDFLKSHKGIPFNTMVSQREYPSDQMPFYAQGFSVCEYLIKVGGHRRLIEFARTGMASGNWSDAVKLCYGYENLGDLQTQWQGWISEWFHSRMPAELPEVVQLASYTEPVDMSHPPFGPRPIIRGQDFSRGQDSTVGPSPLVASVEEPEVGRLIPNLAGEELEPAPVDKEPANLFVMGVGTATPVDPQAPLVRPLSSRQEPSLEQPLRYQGSYGRGIE